MPVPLVAADGSSYRGEQLLVEALDVMVSITGGQPAADIAIAVPAHWGMPTLRALRMRRPTAGPNGMPPGWSPTPSPSLTALNANPGLSLAGRRGPAGLRR